MRGKDAQLDHEKRKATPIRNRISTDINRRNGVKHEKKLVAYPKTQLPCGTRIVSPYLWQFTSFYFGFSFISDLSSIQLATSGDRKYIARENRRRSTNRAKLDKLLIYNGTERSRLQSSAPLAASLPACQTICLQIDKRLQSC